MKTRNELRPQLFWIGIALGAALLSRAPFAFADRPYHDEPVYAFVGASWLNGILPYRDLWDINPPGLFALYALVQSMGAAPFASIWILALAAACASVLGLCALGKAWFGDLRIGAIAGVLFAWFSLASGGMRGPAVFLASPFVIWGLCFVRDSGTFKVFLSGLLLGCAGMILQTTAFEALFAFLLVVIAGAHTPADRSRRAFALVLGGLIPALGFGALLLAQGALQEAWEAVVSVALARSTHHGLSFRDGLVVKFVEHFTPFLPLSLAFVAVALGVSRIFDPQRRSSTLIVLGWVIFSLSGVLLQRAAHDVYVLPLVAPLCLLSAYLCVEVFARWRSVVVRAAVWIVALLGVVFPAGWIAAGVFTGGWVRSLRDVADIVSERAHQHGEGVGLYTGDTDVSLHLLTGQPHVSRFFFQRHLQCAFPLPSGIDQQEEIRRAMARAPRFVTLRDRERLETCTLPERHVLLQSYLDEAYALIGTGGRDGEFRVYELREGMTSSLRLR